jgi:hypothetical protein
MRADIRRIVLGLALAVPFAGCQTSPDDLVNEGRGLVAARQYDQALAKFDEALKAQPDSYEALWGKATVYEQQGKFGDQAEILKKVLAKKEYADKYGQVVRQALETSYFRQAEQAPSDDRKEELLRKAIELNERSGANVTLAKLLMARGDNATKRDDPAAAEAAYKGVQALHVAKKVKKEAQTKAELAGFMVFKRNAQARFDATLKELATAGQYDATGEKFIVEGVADAPGSPKDDAFEANAEAAARNAARTLMDDLTWKVAGKPRPADGGKLSFDEALWTVEEKGWVKKNKSYRARISLPRDAVLFKIYEIENGITAPAGGSDADDDEKPGAPGSQAAPASAAPASAAPASAAPASAAPASAAKP